MPTVVLQHLTYTQLSDKTWCATAHIVDPQIIISSGSEPLSAPQIAHYRRQQQRQGVRLLLTHLLIKVGISDTLEESQFPYRLTKSGYYVCFSHSSCTALAGNHETKVAVIISDRRAVGIDIETQPITWQVAERFYDPAEITILNKLPIAQRDTISKWLWQLKESYIKIHQYTLAQGLVQSYAALIPKLIAGLDKNSSAITMIYDKQADYQIAVLPTQQTLIVF